MWVDYRGILPDVLSQLGYHQRIPVVVAEAYRQETEQLRRSIDRVTEVSTPIGESGFNISFKTRHEGSRAQTLELSLSHPEITTHYLVVPKTSVDSEHVKELYDAAKKQIVSAVRYLRKQILSKREITEAKR